MKKVKRFMHMCSFKQRLHLGSLLIGLPNGQLAEVMEALRKICRRRVEFLAEPRTFKGFPLPLPLVRPQPVSVSGATAFLIPVER